VAVLPEHIVALADGNAHRFSDWPNPEVPRFGACVYTIWHRDGQNGRIVTRLVRWNNGYYYLPGRAFLF
jgi:hypothetical protein